MSKYIYIYIYIYIYTHTKREGERVNARKHYDLPNVDEKSIIVSSPFGKERVESNRKVEGGARGKNI
jgi:hypothetical protein